MPVVRLPGTQSESEALRASEARFRALADAVPVLIANCGADRRFKFVNHAYAARFGMEPEDLAGRHLGEIFGPEVYRKLSPHIDAVLAGRRVEFDAPEAGGSRHMRCSYAPERDGSGKVIGWFAAIVDISDRYAAERELRASEERYRRLAELLPVGVYMCEAPSGRLTYYNEQAVRLWGRTPRLDDSSDRFCGAYRLLRGDGTELPHEEYPMALALSEGRSFRNEEVYVERPDGSRICVLTNIDPIHRADGTVVGAINVFHDMSALKDAERTAREQKQNLQTLLDTVPVAVFITEDPDCGRIYGNQAAAELLRMPPDGDLSIGRGQRLSHCRLLDRGKPLAPDALPVRRAARGEIVRGEEIGVAFDDGTLVHVLISAQPLYDASGRPRGAIASALDITNLKNAELALREADRRKDEFLATLSHELRNPLAPIATALGILDAVRGDSERFADLVGLMERQLGRLVRLIDDLLDVSRISRGKLRLRTEPIELKALVREAVETSRMNSPSSHRLELALPEQPIGLHGDPVRLGQVFSNLLSNAMKYTPAGGRIRVAVERRDGLAEVRVKDTGVGIPAEQLGTVFEMFAQLVPPLERTQGGLGVGLSLARQFVELHGGNIEARSEGHGRGSEFVVRLPIADPGEAAAAARRGEPQEETAPAGPRRILIVDDNIDAATTLAALLEMQGHSVAVAHDGAAAIERAASVRPAAILLDIGLPVMDGYAVCRAIRATSWGKSTFIAAVTGWGADADRRKSATAGFDAHLVKPIDARVLTRLIDALSFRSGRNP